MTDVLDILFKKLSGELNKTAHNIDYVVKYKTMSHMKM